VNSDESSCTADGFHIRVDECSGIFPNNNISVQDREQFFVRMQLLHFKPGRGGGMVARAVMAAGQALHVYLSCRNNSEKYRSLSLLHVGVHFRCEHVQI